MKLDKETGEVMTRGTKLKEMVRSEAWADAKSELTNRLVSLADLTTIDDQDALKLLQEIKVRKLAINLVMGWVREIEGQANQYEANEEAFRAIKEESVILQF